MALSVEQVAAIRTEIGSTIPPTDEELSSAYERLGDTNAVVLEVLRSRLADLASGPTSISIPGVYSENSAGAIKELRSQISSLETGRGIRTSRIIRSGRDRSWPSNSPR